MRLPPGEVKPFDVMLWAEEQAPFLRSAATRLVLNYLTLHAWRTEDNDEGREIGGVLSAYAPIARIQRGTGLGEKTVRRSLIELQEAGYILPRMSPGNGKSEITVFWSEAADDRREDARRGIRPLPKEFRRAPKKAPEPTTDAVVIPLVKRSE